MTKKQDIAACGSISRAVRFRTQELTANLKLNPFYCQRLKRPAAERTAAYYVNTRRRHLSLFYAACRLLRMTTVYK